jgi:hypothetical protein
LNASVSILKAVLLSAAASVCRTTRIACTLLHPDDVLVYSSAAALFLILQVHCADHFGQLLPTAGPAVLSAFKALKADTSTLLCL